MSQFLPIEDIDYGIDSVPLELLMSIEFELHCRHALENFNILDSVLLQGHLCIGLHRIILESGISEHNSLWFPFSQFLNKCQIKTIFQTDGEVSTCNQINLFAEIG